MKFLIKDITPSTAICTKLIKDCLHTDTNKRIKFDILKLHPYFTSNYPLYKPFRGNFYICTGAKGGDVTLGCRDSICTGCIAELMYKEEFASKDIIYFIEKHDKDFYTGKNLRIWLKVKIECPKCLMISEIGD